MISATTSPIFFAMSFMGGQVTFLRTPCQSRVARCVSAGRSACNGPSMPSADGPPAFRRHRIQTIAPFVSERTAVLAPMLYTAIRVTGDDHRVTDQAETNDREHAESDLRGPVTGELEPPVQPHADRLREPWSRNLNLGHQEHPIWHSTRPFRNLGHIDQELYRSPIPPRGSSPPDPAASLRRDPASPFLLSPNSAPPVRLPVPPPRSATDSDVEPIEKSRLLIAFPILNGI